MNKVISVIIIIMLLSVGLVSGCTELSGRETGTWVKIGRVVKINDDVVFGHTFTDWRDDIYFDDGTILESQGADVSSIQLNKLGRFFFEKNYFTYDGSRYKFDNFMRVEYLYEPGVNFSFT